MSTCPTPTVPGRVVFDPGCDPLPGDCSDFYNSCRNPLYALDHQDQCGVLSVTTVTLVPDSIELPVGKSGSVRLIATFSDGRVADVTGESTFWTTDPAIALSMGAGLLSGESVGTTTVSGSWRGKLATGEVIVFDNECSLSAPWDVVVVADDAGVFQNMPVRVSDGGLGSVDGFALRRHLTPMAAGYSTAVLALQLAMDLLEDPTYDPTSGWDGSVIRPSTVGGIRTGSDRIAFPTRGNPTAGDWSNTMQPWPGGTSDIGAALMLALGLHQVGRPNVRKFVVLFSTGGETRCNPTLLSAASALAATGITLAVVTPLSPNDQVFSPCYGANPPMPAYEVLGQAAASCLFFGSIAGNTLGNPYARMLSIACEGCSSGEGIGLGFI